MQQTAVFLENGQIYWYCVILALSVGVGVCFFMACCAHREISALRASASALAAVLLSLLLSRILYWYCRSADFESFTQALFLPRADAYALAGAFAGCAISALVLGGSLEGTGNLLDSMSVAGCGAIALGRLGCFFTDADRGQSLAQLRSLPLAYPTVNAVNGVPEYRLATFVLQAIAALVVFVILARLFFSRRGTKPGNLTLLFLQMYCASQIVLDSTRYDALHLRSNGFLNMVQMLAAIVLLLSFVMQTITIVRAGYWRRAMAMSIGELALLGAAGFLEYYVQRHGKLAAACYGAMSLCMAGTAALAFVLWAMTQRLPGKAEREQVEVCAESDICE